MTFDGDDSATFRVRWGRFRQSAGSDMTALCPARAVIVAADRRRAAG